MRKLLPILLLLLPPHGVARATTPETVTVRLDCSRAMESSYFVFKGQGPCWGHIGHHTYDLGDPWRLGAVSGVLSSVEVQFSPPTEYSPPWATPLTFEVSLDGLQWQPVSEVPYALGLDTRQEGIRFTFDGGGARARYLRIRQPRSAAQGLSGYLDHSELTLTLQPAFVQTPRPGTSLTCAEHIMERFFDEHPCWYGGINRYDSPSFFHTYPVEADPVEAIRGHATVLPWRSDDYTQNGGSRTSVKLFLQASTDSVAWETLRTFTATYGLPVPLEWVGPARTQRFVRLVPEHHTGYGTHPALKHPRGFIVDSALSLRYAA